MKKAYLYFLLFLAAIILFLFLASNYLSLLIIEIPRKPLGQFYSPFAVIRWIKDFEINKTKLYLSFVFSFISVAVFSIFFRILLFKKKKLSDNYGSARWLTYKELKKFGYLMCGGAILGLTEQGKYTFKIDKKSGDPLWRLKNPGKIIFDNSPYHILVSCPTGRGKGINFVIPTLLSWQESIVVYDIKKENYNATGGWRRLFSHVLRVELAAEYSVKINPLAEIIPGHEVEIAQIIAETFADPDGDSKNNYWDIQAKDFIMIIILHVYFSYEEKSLRAVYNFFVDPDKTISQKLAEMLDTNHLGDKPHSTVRSIAKAMYDTAENSEKEMSGIINSVRTKFSVLGDPIVANNLSASDFKISDLVESKLPVSLYYVVSPTDKERLRPITRLFFNLVGKMLTKTEIPKGGALKRHQLALMLDEFISLGNLPFIQDQIAYFRAWKIKLMLITQSFNQIYDKYGERTSIPANCDIKMVMGANDTTDAKIISDLLGTKTIQTKSDSESKNTDSFGIKGESQSKSEGGRQLLTISEITQLPFDRVVLLYAGKSPYFARKLMYYLDNRFTDKVNLPTPDKPAEQISELPPRIGGESATEAASAEVALFSAKDEFVEAGIVSLPSALHMPDEKVQDTCESDSDSLKTIHEGEGLNHVVQLPDEAADKFFFDEDDLL